MDTNPLYDPATDNQFIADETQTMINQPQTGGQLSQEDDAFLKQIVELVDNGTIQLHTPSSLIHHSVYDSLSELEQGKADQNAVAMLAKIRDIVPLYKMPQDTNYQLQNLVSSLRLNKERLEKHGGDLFII